MRAPLAFLLVVVGCGAAAPHRDRAPAAPLTVVVVYDQLGSDTLARLLPELDEAGALRRTIARGHYAHRAVYDYAGTYTAPGHAAIYTGAAPFESGVSANNVWDRTRGRRLSAMDDATYPVLGREGAFASPFRLLVPTVGDRLEEATGGRSVVVSLATKDRSAILPGGHHPDHCLWLDARSMRLTTSTYYAEALPAWAATWAAQHPLVPGVWEPVAPDRWTALGPDDAPGEGAYGWGATFPHDAASAEEADDAFLASPASTELLVSLARTAARELAMGADDVPDLLMISVGATDYAGHAFGPRSWEYADTLFRADRLVGALLAELDAERPIGVVITSDHGVAELVEDGREGAYPGAVRWTSEALLAGLNASLSAEGLPPMAGWVQPYVYLHEDALASEALRERATAAAIAWIEAQPGVARVFDTRRAEALRASSDPLERLVGRSMPPSPPGQLYVVPSEGSVAEEELPPDGGTSHGSPWAYDREVPVVWSGPGVGVAEITDTIPQSDVYETIASLVGLR